MKQAIQIAAGVLLAGLVLMGVRYAFVTYQLEQFNQELLRINEENRMRAEAARLERERRQAEAKATAARRAQAEKQAQEDARRRAIERKRAEAEFAKRQAAYREAHRKQQKDWEAEFESQYESPDGCPANEPFDKWVICHDHRRNAKQVYMCDKVGKVPGGEFFKSCVSKTDTKGGTQ